MNDVSGIDVAISFEEQFTTYAYPDSLLSLQAHIVAKNLSYPPKCRLGAQELNKLNDHNHFQDPLFSVSDVVKRGCI